MISDLTRNIKSQMEFMERLGVALDPETMMEVMQILLDIAERIDHIVTTLSGDDVAPSVRMPMEDIARNDNLI